MSRPHHRMFVYTNFCKGITDSWHDVLCRWLQVAGLCSLQRGGWGEPMFYLCEVSRWETTGHCSPEIQSGSVHLGYPPALALLTCANQRRGGPAEQNPYNPGCHAGHSLHLRPSCSCGEGPQCHENPSWNFSTKTLVATCKAIVRPILNYAAPIWFTSLMRVLNTPGQTWGHPEQGSEDHESMTGCHQKAKTGVLPLASSISVLHYKINNDKWMERSSRVLYHEKPKIWFS